MTVEIAEALEAKSIPVYVHSQIGDEEAKVAGKLLVDCKVCQPVIFLKAAW